MSMSSRLKLRAQLRAAQRQVETRPGLARLRGELLIALGDLAMTLLIVGTAAGLLVAACIFAYLVVLEENIAMAMAVFFVAMLPLGAVAYSLLGMARRSPPIERGIILTASDAPRLFEELERIRRELKTPRVHRVLLSSEFGARIYARPIVGGFGGTEPYLTLGLPLLWALSAEQAMAVVAHEIGHLSGHVNQFERRIGRAVAKWMILYDSMMSNSALAARILRPFLRWYVPKLRMIESVWQRSLEFEADRLSCRIVGAAVAREALISTSAMGACMSKLFWPRIFESSLTTPMPPEDIFMRQRAFMSDAETLRVLPGWLNWSLRGEADPEASHPTPRERLAALEEPPCAPADLKATLPACPPLSAAEALLGEMEEEFATLLQNLWRQGVTPDWVANHRRATSDRPVLEQLRRRHEKGEKLTRKELEQLGTLVEQSEGRRASYKYCRELLEQNREDPRACLAFGMLMVREGDERGIPYLEYAMEVQPLCTEEACQTICRHFYEQGRLAEATPYERKAGEFRAVYQEARAERDTVQVSDSFLPHDIDPMELSEMSRRLSDVPEILSAWLVRKETTIWPEWPLYVLVVGAKNPMVWDARLMEKVLSLLDFKGETMCFWVGEKRGKLAKRIQRVNGSCFHDTTGKAK